MDMVRKTAELRFVARPGHWGGDMVLEHSAC